MSDPLQGAISSSHRRLCAADASEESSCAADETAVKTDKVCLVVSPELVIVNLAYNLLNFCQPD